MHLSLTPNFEYLRVYTVALHCREDKLILEKEILIMYVYLYMKTSEKFDLTCCIKSIKNLISFLS